MDDIPARAAVTEPAPIDFGRADLAALMSRRAQAWAPRFAGRSIRFDVALEAAVVVAHPASLAQAIDSLLSNALRYSDAGGRVGLSVARSGGNARLAVSDHGVGIAADDLPRIFDRFFRSARTRVRAIGGSGLGLAMAQDVVRAHGGQLTAESHAGGQTTLEVVLPLATQPD